MATAQLIEIIEAHEREYERIRIAAEEENDVRYARWHTSDEKEVARVVEERRKARNGEGYFFHLNVFPDQDFYQQYLVPQLEKISADASDFERLSTLSLRSLEKISHGHTPSAESKRGIVGTFFGQFFKFLHQEDEQVVLGIAGLQSQRANLHNGDGDYPIREWDVRKFIESFKESEFAGYLADAAEITGNISNGFVAETYFHNALEVLKKFKEEGLDSLIPKYLQLSKEAKRPDENGFDFKSPGVVDIFKKLQGTGKHFDAALKYYSACIKQGDNYVGFGMGGIDSLVEEINRLEKSEFQSRVSEILETATCLRDQGLNGSTLIKRINRSNPVFLSNEKNILVYALDLGKISTTCADTYMLNAEEVFELPSEQRQRLHNIGLKFAREFGDNGKAFFNVGVNVLKHHPEKFDTWLNKVNQYGRLVPKELSSWGGFMERALELLESGLADRVLDAVFNLYTQVKILLDSDDSVAKRLRRFSMDSPYSSFFEGLSTIIDAGIDLHQYSNDIFALYKSEILMYAQNISGAVRFGLDYGKYVELLPELVQYGLGNTEKEKIAALVNSNIHFNKKTELLKEYSLAAMALMSMPELDLEGKWKLECKGQLTEIIKKRLKIDTTGLELSDMIKLSSIKKTDTNMQKLRYIVKQASLRKPIAKSFELGKVYGVALVSGVSSKGDPVQLTEQLVYGLISRDPEKRRGAEAYFEPEKLEEARQFISQKHLFNLIKKDLSHLKAGSAEAAKNVLEVLTEAYAKKEVISDMVVSIESLFDGDIRFDSLEMRIQEGTFSDLFDNRRTLCCAFFPTGVKKGSSINYLLDENIGLLHIVPKIGQYSYEPIGVAILVNAYSPETGEKYLMVDSMEAGIQIDRIRDSIWIPLTHSSIMGVGEDNGCDKVMYNISANMNAKPRKVISYLKRTFDVPEESVELIKQSSDNPLLGRFVRKQSKDFEFAVSAYKAAMKQDDNYLGSSEGYELMQKVECLRKAIAGNFSQYLEACGGSCLMPSGRFGYRQDVCELPKIQIGGNITGLVFNVK